jgi:hypothetical protein
LCAAAAVFNICTADTQTLLQLEPKVIETAVNRGKFEMNCPAHL